MSLDSLNDLPLLISRLAAEHDVPGVSVGVLADEHITTYVHGVANVDTQVPVTPDTVFQIGSNTKPVTATAIMRMVDDGQVELDAPVTEYLPEFRLHDVDASTVTVQHLLSHQGGFLGDYPGSNALDWADDCIARYVAELADVAQLHPVGELWSYANSGMVVLGRVIEKITGMRFDHAVTKMVLEPLGAHHSRFRPEDILLLNAAVGHQRGPHTEDLRPVRTYVTQPWRAPSGSMMVSTARDLLRFARLHLDDGRAPQDARLLAAHSARRMRSQHAEVPATGATYGYGLGWAVRKLADGQDAFGHGGTTGTGQMSAFEIVPAQRIAVVALSNSHTARTVNEQIVNHVLERLAGAPMAQLVTVPAQVPDLDLSRYPGRYDGVNSVIDISLEDDRRLRADIATDLLEDEPDEPVSVTLVPVDAQTFTTGNRQLDLHFIRPDHDGRPTYVSALGRIFPRTGAQEVR